MSRVRLLVGTKKGAFVLNSDAKREKWAIDGPHFAGWEIYHMKGSPADPNRLYASQTSSWFGQVIQRSNDGGKTWEPVGNKFEYDGVTGAHQWYDGTPHPWEFKRVWHLEPSLKDPDTVYAGVEDAALFRASDGGQTWQELAGLRGTIRDHVTQRRRPFLRFFTCEQDLSHESPDAPLPDAVASGAEPLLVVGAIAGG
jgi:hypothetical protein